MDALPTILLLAVPLAAALSAGLILRLFPLLQRYALARPNARSSHRVPTPQGGGIAVVTALVTISGLLIAAPEIGGRPDWIWLAAARWPWRFWAPWTTCARCRPAFGSSRRPWRSACWSGTWTDGLLPGLPLDSSAARPRAGLWFVNLTNFMDGLDWISWPRSSRFPAPCCCSASPVSCRRCRRWWPPACSARCWVSRRQPPVARLFLGDVGALPIGLVTAWLLWHLAWRTTLGERLGGRSLAAALLLPLTYLADASLTLAARARRRERIWEAHRGHFYQRATVNGLTVPGVVGRVFAVKSRAGGARRRDLVLAVLAGHPRALAAGLALVAALLRRFARAPGAGLRSAAHP